VQIREIKVGELLDFIKSDEFEKLDIKPITDLRAISQFNNPEAKPEDLALIYAAEGNELLGFAGLLPKTVNNENTRIFANSCWWAHPEKGKGIAIPLFYKLVERANFSLFLSESTTHAKTILEKTGLFGPINQKIGIRGFLRFYLADISLKHYPHNKWLPLPFKFLDSLLNLLLLPFRFCFLKKFDKSNFTFELVSKVDREIEEFIKQNSLSEFVRKTPLSYDWFKNYPWVTEKASGKALNYPFSYVVNNYELNYFVFKRDNEIKAFAAVSYRDNLAKIPFIYFNNNDIKAVTHTLMRLILKKRYDSLLVFHPQIVDFMGQNKMPFFYRKNEIKYSGTTKKIYDIFAQKPIMQDGDGDVIFT
jgi:hypothetical protein